MWCNAFAGKLVYMSMIRPFFAALAAALVLAAPLAARAQDDTPSYAQHIAQDAQIHGRILSFDGAYSLQVRDEKGYVDNVQLHQGTIINPTGLTLAPGMIVSIMGYNAGNAFAANQIDTPYTYTYGVPYYGGHPWNYYGPSFSLGFFFGNPGWWHGGYYGSSYRFNGGARIYDHIGGPMYHGGVYHGRNYAAPAEHGGYYPRPGARAPMGGERGGEGRGGGGEHHASGGGDHHH